METKENLNKGITLVALVITIIILLILAGVAITALTQTGLFENAKQAKNAMENAQTKENATLEDYVNKIDGKISGNRENIENIGVELLTDPIIIDTSTNFEEKNLDFEISDISQYNYLLLTYGPYTESNKSFGISTQLLNKKTIEKSQILRLFYCFYLLYISFLCPISKTKTITFSSCISHITL